MSLAEFTHEHAAPKGTRLDALARTLVHRAFSDLRRGTLRIEEPGRDPALFGAAGTGPDAALRVEKPAFYRELALGGDIALGETYTDGLWDTGDLTAVLSVFADNIDTRGSRGWRSPATLGLAITRRLFHLRNRNTRGGSERNISYHYDLSNDFFRLFLDRTMTYSCALFRREDETLEQAQYNKIHALLDRLEIAPRHHLLEIGSGWGALALEAARRTGCRVTTITLSREQQKVVEERIAAEGLADRIDVQFCDYREMTGKFDRIVSVEMLEAVGHEYLGAFFRTVDRLLKRNGLAALQVITLPDQRYDRYRRNPDWLQKYIFPGAVVPSLGAIQHAMTTHSRLTLHEVESMGIHYARTLREWRRAFLARRDEVLALGFDKRFLRMWEYYLCYCEAGFERRILNTVQLLLTRPNNTTLRVYGHGG